MYNETNLKAISQYLFKSKKNLAVAESVTSGKVIKGKDLVQFAKELLDRVIEITEKDSHVPKVSSTKSTKKKSTAKK
ncbi:hypothetical protein [Ferruginibacter albus]|uniref:hypothetical protein n=1 Tax=Ferruginibacter albus TaxID=2875540 RepID=UPI001CC65390|nr:hypothetical protein [Ferruginibacter albus]UAY52877.1 hypothetical protein K9M53_04160 [Ferruginibacter albus]